MAMIGDYPPCNCPDVSTLGPIPVSFAPVSVMGVDPLLDVLLDLRARLERIETPLKAERE